MHTWAFNLWNHNYIIQIVVLRLHLCFLAFISTVQGKSKCWSLESSLCDAGTAMDGYLMWINLSIHMMCLCYSLQWAVPVVWLIAQLWILRRRYDVVIVTSLYTCMHVWTLTFTVADLYRVVSPSITSLNARRLLTSTRLYVFTYPPHIFQTFPFFGTLFSPWFSSSLCSAWKRTRIWVQSAIILRGTIFNVAWIKVLWQKKI